MSAPGLDGLTQQSAAAKHPDLLKQTVCNLTDNEMQSSAKNKLSCDKVLIILILVSTLHHLFSFRRMMNLLLHLKLPENVLMEALVMNRLGHNNVRCEIRWVITGKAGKHFILRRMKKSRLF